MKTGRDTFPRYFYSKRKRPIKEKHIYYISQEWDFAQIEKAHHLLSNYMGVSHLPKIEVFYEFIAEKEIFAKDSGEVVALEGRQHNGLGGYAGGIIRELEDLYFPATQRVIC